MVKFFLLILFLCLPLANAGGEPGEESKAEGTSECEAKENPCAREYHSLIEDYQRMGCHDFREYCKGKNATWHEECKNLLKMAKNFKKFPNPTDFLSAPSEICQKSESKCPKADTSKMMEKDLAEEKKRGACFPTEITPPEIARNERKMADEIDLPFEVNPAGAAPQVPIRKNESEIKHPDGHVKVAIVSDEIIAGYKECLEKQSAALLAEKDHFCQRLYTSPTQTEGGKGTMPAELEGHLNRAYAAHLSHTKTTIKIEFWTHEGCKTELRKQDGIHGGVIAFFFPYSHDLDMICTGLILKDIGELWQFVTGSRDTNMDPIKKTGKFLP